MAALRLRPPRRSLPFAGSGRSTPVRPAMSCSKISGSSMTRPRLPVKVCGAGWSTMDCLLEPGDQSVLIGFARAFGDGDEQMIGELRPVRMKARDRNAGEDAPPGHGLHHVRRRLRQGNREFVEE